MKIEYISLGDLKPYENNPRVNTNAIDEVAKSIMSFGFKVPLVIDKDNVIVCGHTRYEASLKIGLKEAPCIRADDLNEDQIRAFRLADNKVGERSRWDDDGVKSEMSGMSAEMLAEFGEMFAVKEEMREWATTVSVVDEESGEEIVDDGMMTCPFCGYSGSDDEFDDDGGEDVGDSDEAVGKSESVQE